MLKWCVYLIVENLLIVCFIIVCFFVVMLEILLFKYVFEYVYFAFNVLRVDFEMSVCCEIVLVFVVCVCMYYEIIELMM